MILAKQAGFTPDEFSKEILSCYACLCSMEMDESKSDLMEQLTIIKNEHINITVTRTFHDDASLNKH